MKRILLFVLMILSLTVCRKQDNKTYLLEGRLMSSCTTPAPNKEMFISQPYGALLGTGGSSKTFTSDDNGYFSFEFTRDDWGGGRYKLGVKGASYILEDIPLQDIDLGNVYINNFSEVAIKVKVNNNYAASVDTFYTGFYGGTPLIMPTPLHDTIHEALTAYSFDVVSYRNKSEFKLEYGWNMKNGNSYSVINTFTKNVPICNVIADTIYITVD